ncbi:MAG: class I SAM-dependent methyltransferase [Calditrichaeota bacterium]|nr:MAG: class I SAM-dependent methyltransferase [Calditrichota bacterium]
MDGYGPLIDAHWGLETTQVLPSHRLDLRTTPPDVFKDESATDWFRLRWSDIGRPYIIPHISRRRRMWEEIYGQEMPERTQWEHFNKCFHDLFVSDIPAVRKKALKRLRKYLRAFDFTFAIESLRDYLHLSVWNRVHRVEDAIWDPRGKRALFDGLEVKHPRILFLGAADGYEAMQLLALYPGGEAVLVDYDEFCKTDRFGKFPESYPFLGKDPATGHWRVYHREHFRIDYLVEDIRNLKLGREFDIVLSVGLLEHYPDEQKPEVLEWHRKFLKPGGYAIITTPRDHFKSRLFFRLMGELMNFVYRELMTAHQLGLYAFENGFEILRCGYIKAHNAVIARSR